MCYGFLVVVFRLLETPTNELSLDDFKEHYGTLLEEFRLDDARSLVSTSTRSTSFDASSMLRSLLPWVHTPLSNSVPLLFSSLSQ